MLPYEYSKLNADAQEIRLVTLLPGEFSEDIRFVISHTPLIMPDERPSQRMSLDDLHETLPPDWTAYETLEGRFIFYQDESDGTTWTHPDPSFNDALYEPRPELPYPGFQPVYEALSYTWGSTDNRETAYVESSASLSPSSGPITATIQIGQNLASALRHLRYQAEARVLWIDAMCINQEDIAERNEQVQRMATIYRLAYRVVVWLGPETGNSKLAISTLRYLGAQMVDRFPDGIDETLQEAREFFLTKISASRGPIDLSSINDQHHYDWVRKRTLVTTEEGYIGLGLAGAQPGDCVCVFPGCNTPMLLRLGSSEQYQVVGECYIHGLMDSESLLGRLPNPWRVRLGWESGGIYLGRYYNSSTGVLTEEDPRLDSLPVEWERVQADRTPDDPLVFALFRNKVTGEVMNSDPRLLPEALKERGVDLKTFQLI
ncbi:hypothetical protein W97_09284 [Coniosporium apollinis CBS 100218]|uniref:WW domain-containing protein n=1 Tax=Coniosporium apollinis (strain CBS 100218) TaxID=1168221 RepID=R7Z7D2_CONA1|nr:uncharacterized protein W97_09284 [Coniosporium apollinis CBS 100218]EON70018.1 hypothetical protein W97_09284 [Coniosporium apollinis CBS 100218]